MLRGDNLVCGTSTTGTGDLTLAATPGPPGGVDFYQFLTATGIGFANGADILVSYTITEYTDSTFATAKAMEKGVGLLHLGTAIGGGTPSTLARTTKQSSATSLDSQPATQNIAPGTGIDIGTAANTLVFIGASAADLMAFAPYVQVAGGDATGAGPISNGQTGTAAGSTYANGVHEYIPFLWGVPMLVKSCTVRVTSALTGGASRVYARIYAKTTGGQPGKLLYDFGASAAPTATGNLKIPGGALGSGFFLMPGEYFLDLLNLQSTDSGNLQFLAAGNSTIGSSGILTSGFMGMNSGQAITCAAAFTDSAAAGPDPAFLTNWAVRTGVGFVPQFVLNAS